MLIVKLFMTHYTSSLAAGGNAPTEYGKHQRNITLESLKHTLWYGNVDAALEHLERLSCDRETNQWRSAAVANLSRGVHEFEMAARDNHLFILDLGERDRQGNRISTAFVESIVNQVISKRFVKTQQIQWTPEGARLLLQTQTRIPLLVTSMPHSVIGIRSS